MPIITPPSDLTVQVQRTSWEIEPGVLPGEAGFDGTDGQPFGDSATDQHGVTDKVDNPGGTPVEDFLAPRHREMIYLRFWGPGVMEPPGALVVDSQHGWLHVGESDKVKTYSILSGASLRWSVLALRSGDIADAKTSTRGVLLITLGLIFNLSLNKDLRVCRAGVTTSSDWLSFFVWALLFGGEMADRELTDEELRINPEASRMPEVSE